MWSWLIRLILSPPDSIVVGAPYPGSASKNRCGCPSAKRLVQLLLFSIAFNGGPTCARILDCLKLPLQYLAQRQVDVLALAPHFLLLHKATHHQVF